MIRLYGKRRVLGEEMGWNHGIAIANICKQNGLSQRKLAEMAGVRNSTISRIEDNKVNPDFESIEKIVDALELEYMDYMAIILGGDYYGRDEHKGNVQVILWFVCMHSCA